METGKDPGTLLKVLKVQGRASSIKKLAVSNGRGHGAEHKEHWSHKKIWCLVYSRRSRAK